MVAMVSAKGLRWSSSQAAGYTRARRSTVSSARRRAPRGAAAGRARARAPLALRGAEVLATGAHEPPGHGRDPRPLRAIAQSGGGRPHHGAEVTCAPRPHLLDHGP